MLHLVATKLPSNSFLIHINIVILHVADMFWFKFFSLLKKVVLHMVTTRFSSKSSFNPYKHYDVAMANQALIQIFLTP